MTDQITESVERLLEFTMPLEKVEADERRMADEPQNLGLNPVRQIYSAGTSEFAEYCRRLDYISYRPEQKPSIINRVQTIGSMAIETYQRLVAEYYD